MKCKSAPQWRLLNDDGKRRSRPRRLVRAPSLCEGVYELAGERRRIFALGDAVVIGQLAFRHVEGAEQHVEDRKRGGKILLAAAIRCGVVPAI